MGYKNKTNLEYQIDYYYKNRDYQLLRMRQYNRKYYLKNREQIANIRAEYKIEKLRERNKNKDNVVIVSNKIIISIIED